MIQNVAAHDSDERVTDTTTRSVFITSAFWEQLWRTSGLQFVTLFILGYFIYGYQPGVRASAETLVAFYEGARTRILIAAVCSGLALLNLMWFAAALRTTLADAGQDGWGAAAKASSAAFGGMFLLLITLGATLAYSIGGSGNALTSGLNASAWSLVVLTSFPRAMLIMSSAFGLWRAGLISNALFTAGVVMVVLILLGATTWARAGFWAPDGNLSRVVSPLACVIWVLVVSRILLSRNSTPRSGW